MHGASCACLKKVIYRQMTSLLSKKDVLVTSVAVLCRCVWRFAFAIQLAVQLAFTWAKPGCGSVQRPPRVTHVKKYTRPSPDFSPRLRDKVWAKAWVQG